MAACTCAKCGKQFEARIRKNAGGVYYCSRECWYSRNHDGMPVSCGLTQHKCVNCGKEFNRRRGSQPKNYKRDFCSRECYHSINAGETHAQWGGGKYICPSKGYVMEYTGCGRRRAEHILIAERVLGRRLKHGEVVHHINGNKSDNRNTNLLICDAKYHAYLHWAMSMKYASMLET